MSSNTYSNPRLFIGDKEITNFASVGFTESGKSQVSKLNVNIPDPELRRAALENKEIKFFLNYGSDDNVPFFRGRIRQATPTDTAMQIVAHDVRTFLTGIESIPLSLTDESNYDGYTIGQFLHSYITEFVNINETIIGLDMLNDTDPVVSLSGVRGKKLNALKIVTNNLKDNQNDFNDIRLNRLMVRDDGIKSNIVFVKEQGLDDAAVKFTYSDGIKSLSVKKRPAPNLLSTEVEGVNVLYKHNNFAKGITGANIKGKFDSPDEATKAAFVQAKKAETDVEISLDTTKGHYLDIGNVVFVFVQDYPEITGKHRIVSKSVNCSKAAVTCKLQLAKERPQLSEYFSN